LAQEGSAESARAIMRAAVSVVLVTAVQLRQRLDPYDCYVEKGEKYPGLQHRTTSGRECQNWLSQKPHEHTYGSADTGLGNHNYCRNPGSSKDSPWCYTLDDGKEWEYCDVPVCPPPEETPEAWTAPEGMKSEGEPTPCVPDEPTLPYVSFEVTINGVANDQASCMSSKGKTNWLIGMKRHKADDEEGCISSCLTTAGADYVVHWPTALESGDNCACFRECIPTEDANDGAINMPKVYRLRPPSLLQLPPCKPVKKALLRKGKAAPDLWRQAKDRAMKKIAQKKR